MMYSVLTSRMKKQQMTGIKMMRLVVVRENKEMSNHVGNSCGVEKSNNSVAPLHVFVLMAVLRKSTRPNL